MTFSKQITALAKNHNTTKSPAHPQAVLLSLSVGKLFTLHDQWSWIVPFPQLQNGSSQKSSPKPKQHWATVVKTPLSLECCSGLHYICIANWVNKCKVPPVYEAEGKSHHLIANDTLNHWLIKRLIKMYEPITRLDPIFGKRFRVKNRRIMNIFSKSLFAHIHGQ